MLKMQNNINQRIHPDWRSQNHAWYRAIWIECAELMDHHGWKWWKKQKADPEQIHLELVDIWHFGLSDCLQQAPASDNVTAGTQNLLSAANTPAEYPDLLTGVECFTCETLTQKRFSPASFFGLTRLANLDLETLYKLYVSKNVLNFFRQDHGYQTGSYQKIWANKEDNTHLSEIIDNSQAIPADLWQEHLYQQLSKRYEQSLA